MAYPQRYVLDPSIIGTADADKAKAACKYGAIDLDMQEETIELNVGAVDLGDRLEALRRGEDPALRLRPLRQRDHQRRVRAPRRSARADRRQAAAPVRRQGGEEHRLHPVRRLARREPPAPLLAHLLHGVAEADAVRARGLGRRGEVDRLLHRHPRHRPPRGLLPEGAEGPDGDVRQVQGREHRAGRRRPATRSCTAWTPRATTATRPRTTSSCSRSAWSRRATASRCPPTSIRDSSGFIEGAADGGQFGAGAASIAARRQPRRCRAPPPRRCARSRSIAPEPRAERRSARPWRHENGRLHLRRLRHRRRARHRAAREDRAEGRQDAAWCSATTSCARPPACRRSATTSRTKASRT